MIKVQVTVAFMALVLLGCDGSKKVKDTVNEQFSWIACIVDSTILNKLSQ